MSLFEKIIAKSISTDNIISIRLIRFANRIKKKKLSNIFYTKGGSNSLFYSPSTRNYNIVRILILFFFVRIYVSVCATDNARNVNEPRGRNSKNPPRHLNTIRFCVGRRRKCYTGDVQSVVGNKFSTDSQRGTAEPRFIICLGVGCVGAVGSWVFSKGMFFVCVSKVSVCFLCQTFRVVKK